jgi:hypothetical protein
MVNIDAYTTYTCSIEKDDQDKPLVREKTNFVTVVIDPLFSFV